MHYSFMTAILVYIVVIKIVMQTGYIRSEDPIGTWPRHRCTLLECST